MKFNINDKSKKFGKNKKFLKDLLDTDECRFMEKVCIEMTSKLIVWELMIGEDMLKTLLRTYLGEEKE